MNSNLDIARARQLAVSYDIQGPQASEFFQTARELLLRYRELEGIEAEYIRSIAEEYCQHHEQQDFWFQLTKGPDKCLRFRHATPEKTIEVVESLVRQHPRGEGFVYGNAHKVGELKTLLNKAWRGQEHITLRHGFAEIATNAGISTIDFSSALETYRPRRRSWIWFCGGLETSQPQLVDFFVDRLHVGSQHKLILT